MDAAWIALIGTVFGGVGLKIIDYYLSKNRVRVDDAARIRDELRIEITNLRDDVARLETERDKYRNDYYALMEKMIAVQREIQELKAHIIKQTP